MPMMTKAREFGPMYTAGRIQQYAERLMVTAVLHQLGYVVLLRDHGFKDEGRVRRTRPAPATSKAPYIRATARALRDRCRWRSRFSRQIFEFSVTDQGSTGFCTMPWLAAYRFPPPWRRTAALAYWA